MACPELENSEVVAWHGMVVDIDDQKQLERELEHLSVTDELTGLYNRRYFMQRLDEALAESARYQTPYALLSLDVDRFKVINDTLGHLAGDAALRLLARVLDRRARRTDLVARIGGEEFVLLMPQTGLQEAEVLAEQVRQLVAQSPFELQDGQRIQLTLSGGVVSWQGAVAGTSEILGLCDRLLYRAKSQGRNRVLMAQI